MEQSNSNHVGSLSVADSARIQIGNNSTINNTTNNYSQDDDKEYLAALSLTDPRQDKIRIEQTNGGLLKESYLWVLQNPEFECWREAGESQPLLWIRGDPGKGKTMLLSGIIDELQPFTTLEDSTSLTSLSYFFCQATNPGLNNATAVLRGLVYLLVDQHPDLLCHVRGKLPLDPEHWNSYVAIRAIFLKMLQDPSLQSVILIVDALDECETDGRVLLSVITATMSRQVRWLVSSRNIRMIEMILTQAQGNLVLSLELNAQSVSQAISKYIQHQMDRLSSRSNLKSDELGSTSSYLHMFAHGTFLWVALVCQQLEVCNDWEVKDLLERPPQGLNELYERMMERVTRPISADLYTSIIALVFTAYRPITFSELVIIRDLPRNKEMVPKMIMECGGFLAARDGVIYLVHQSAKDFLAKQQHILFPSGLTQHHLGLFDSCLNSLEVLKMDIYNQVHPAVFMGHTLNIRPEPDPLSGLFYSCEFWAHHLRDAQLIRAQDTSHSNRAHQFIANKFLFWLEALTLTWKLPSAMETLRILKDLPLGDEASALVEDAWQFFLYFRPIIKDYPLQIYASGLIFSPEKSLIRQHFEHCSPKFVVKKPRVDGQWRPHLRVPGKVPNMKFSTDNKSLVTTSFNEVIKWNVSDGMEITSAHFNGLDFITTSPDLNWFAGVTTRWYSPGPSLIPIALQIRDLESNSIKWSREFDNGEVRGMKFSPNSQWLAVCFDEELVLWEFKKNSFQRWPLKIFCFPRRKIEFSSDGALVALFSSTYTPSETIVVVDVRTGEHHKNPNAKIEWIDSVVFLPNTHEIMMCWEKGVWSWDIAGGKCQEWLGSDDCVEHITSSHDASWIALVSGLAVSLYGKQTQEFLQHFEVPSTFDISSIAISFDDRRLAIHSSHTVWLCDVPSSILKETHSDRVVVKRVFISENKRLMAWALERKIQVLDTTTGLHLCEFDMPWFWGLGSLEPSSTDNLASFSSNGHLLAASSCSPCSSSLLSVWDLSSQRLAHKIGVAGSIRQLAVSHGGNGCERWVAAITAKYIYVWDATTMRLQWSLVHASYKGRIALQFIDGKLAVLGSLGHDYSLIYYRVTTGTRLTHVKLPSQWSSSPEEGFSLSPSGQRATWGSRGGEFLVIFISQEEAYIQMVLSSFRGLNNRRLCFVDDSTVLTDQGMLNIDTILAEAASEPNTLQHTRRTIRTLELAFFGCGCNKDRDWITLDGYQLLWLPLHFRPRRTQIIGFASGERHFAMHCLAGVFFIEFSHDARDLLLHPRGDRATWGTWNS